MPRPRLAGLTPGRLRLGLGVLFVALALPTAVLIQHAYGQLKWEAFHRQRLLAEEFVARVDAALAARLAAEEARPTSDYAFLVVAGDPATRYVTRSPLAAYPAVDALPGTVGHFQVDADGRFSSPLLPEAGVDPSRYGVGPDELAERSERVARIHDLLGRGRLDDDAVAGTGPTAGDAEEPPARARAETETEATEPSADRGAGLAFAAREADEVSEGARRKPDAVEAKKARQAPSQALFDQLTSEQASTEEAPRSLGRVEALQLEERYRDAKPQEAQLPAASAPAGVAAPEPRPLRKERNYVPAPRLDAAPDDGRAAAAAQAVVPPPIRAFDSDVDPLRVALLDADHFVFYRNVWRAGRRLVQGLLVAREPLLRAALLDPFAGTALARSSDLAVAWRGEVLAALAGPAGGRYLDSTADLRGELLHRARLSAPLGEMELVLGVTRLPPGPGGRVLAWTGGVLALAFVVGFVGLYRLGLGQIRLVRQQQDFVSAVSHELKTPLTSIRMYGEMLQQGWVDEAKRSEYYTFIHGESERLSRLIDNVLQLARLSRNGLQVAPQRLTAVALCDLVRSKVSAQVTRAGFELVVTCDGVDAETAVEVDPDLFLQVVINLVDNALKFAARSEPKRLELACRRGHDGSLGLALRDHGPGIPPGQMKKIFRLFYRPGDELTRETVGTGIGLALVHQLVTAMGGTVDVVNREPGAEFRLRFPAR